MSDDLQTSNLQTIKSVVPAAISSTVIQPLQEKGYCDLCCKPMQSAFMSSCGHCYCGDCLVAIGQQENVDIDVQLLQEAAVRATVDGDVLIKTQTDDPSMSQKDTKSLPKLPCPLCLRIMETFQAINPQQRLKAQLCQECQQRERIIRCGTCGSELCEQCDAQIHKFSTMKTHVRTPTANGGNAGAMEVELQCQAACHRSVLAGALLRGTTDPTVKHPLFVDSATTAPAVAYCKDDGILICKHCRESEYYANKQVLTLEEGAELRIRSLRNEGDKCRQLTNELRALLQKYDECGNLDGNLFQIAIAELKTARDALVSALNGRFQAMEEQAARILEQREAMTKGQRDSLLQVVGKMADAVVSAEKHMVQRQPSVFLLEYPDLLQQVKSGLKVVLQDLEKRPEPRRTAFPRISRIDELKSAIDALQFDQTQVFVEQAGDPGRRQLSCKDCGNVLVPNAASLAAVARKQKGCLFGLLIEQLTQNAVVLDAQRGQPGSRHVLCKRCTRELGRWAQPDADDKKFTPGFVFISDKVVK